MITGRSLTNVDKREPTYPKKGKIMTSKAMETIRCPACGSHQKIELYETINAMDDPVLVEKLLAGEINLFTCASCNHKAQVEAPLLFNDLRLGLKIQYFPAILLDKDPENLCKQYFGMMAEMKSFQEEFGFMAKSIRNQSIYIVFSMEEMVAQIKFRALLDNHKG
jgi:hypothetical protein